MTKFEWDRQFKKGISSLPKSEQQRVIDYYNELFADKIELNMREVDIIAEFGNPYEVANKLIVDFRNENHRPTDDIDNFVYSVADKYDFDEFETPKNNNYSRAEQSAAKKEKNYKSVDKKSIKGKKATGSATGILMALALIYFFVSGAIFDNWHPAWMVFLLVPIISSIITAVVNRNILLVGYPLIVTFLFLLAGFYSGLWHPMWILFLTIPLFYSIAGSMRKNKKQEEKEREEEEFRVKKDRDCRDNRREESNRRYDYDYKSPQKSNSKPTAGKIILAIILALIFIYIAIFIWTAVIGLFTGGIGMIIGGIAVIIAAIAQFMSAATSALLILGAGILLLGLGLVFAVGFASLFKACARMCRAMYRCVYNCVN